jgi:hypothetical protein
MTQPGQEPFAAAFALVDKYQRQRAMMQFFDAIFHCMVDEQVPLSRAIALCRDYWHANRDADPLATPEMSEKADEIWTAAVFAAQESFDKMAALVALGR